MNILIGLILLSVLLIGTWFYVKQNQNTAPALIIATELNDIRSVEQMLKNGADVNATTILGSTALIIASQNGNAEIVELLIRHQADVHAQAAKFHNITALYQAVSYNHLDIVKLLLNSGANPNQTIDYNVTPLFNATRYNEPEIMKVLIDNGADVNHIDIDGFTALMYAAIDGNFHLMKLLIAHGADFEQESIEYLLLVCENKEILSFLESIKNR